MLVRLGIGAPADPEDIQEFEQLARSAGAIPVASISGRRDRPDPRFFVGSGKADEIRAVAAEHNADVVLFDHPLSPSQERNLEKLIERRVLDRSGLILDIFAQRARSHEGKLEVELAQLKHIASRLVRGWTHLERQRGGGIGNRGPGETQLETDRRLLGKRVKTLTGAAREDQTAARDRPPAARRDPVPSLALVGYTNAGKSTLFRALTGADAYVADQLFATLDPTVRRIVLPGNTTVVVADTVGFIRELPHELVAAFQSTLTEAREATLLLHVVDVSDPAARRTHRRSEPRAGRDRRRRPAADPGVQQDRPHRDARRASNATNPARAATCGCPRAQAEGLDLLRKRVAERLARVARRATLRLPVSARRTAGAAVCREPGAGRAHRRRRRLRDRH